LKFAEKVVFEKKPFLLVLDEINLAVAANLISVEEILSLLSKYLKKPRSLNRKICTT